MTFCYECALIIYVVGGIGKVINNQLDKIKEAATAYKEAANEYDAYCKQFDKMSAYHLCVALDSEEHQTLLQKMKKLEDKYFNLIKEL